MGDSTAPQRIPRPFIAGPAPLTPRIHLVDACFGWEAADMIQPQRAYSEMAGNLRQARERLERLEYVSTALMGLSLALLVGAAMM